MRRVTAFLFACLIVPPLPGEELPLHRGRTVQQWVDDLAHPYLNVRVEAAKALAEFAPSSEQAISSLITALADRSADIRLYAAYGLGRIKQQPERCLPALTELLEDDDEHVRYSAEWALVRIGTSLVSEEHSEGEIKLLDELLSAAEAKLKKNVERREHLRLFKQARASFVATLAGSPALQAIEPTQVDAELSRWLADLQGDDPLTQLRAIEALTRRRAVAQLMRVWETTARTGFLDWHVSRALAGLGEAAAPELRQALRHEDEQLAYQAAQCFQQMGPQAACVVHDLVAMIDDTSLSDERRETAIWVVESIGPPAQEAIETLRGVLQNDENDLLLAASARALAAVGKEARSAIPTLIQVVQRSDLTDDARSAAAEALSKIAPESREAVRVVLAWLRETEDPFTIGSLCDAIGQFGPNAVEAVPALVEAVHETDDYSRQSAIRALGHVGPEAAPAIPLLIERLTDAYESVAVQVAAAVALGNLGPAAIRELGTRLEHPEPYVRQTVARALVEIGIRAKPVSSGLLVSLSDPQEDAEVRALAAVALGQIGVSSNEVITALADVTNDAASSDYLRSMAAVSLGQLQPDSTGILAAGLHDTSAAFQIAAAYSLQKMPAPHPEALPTLVEALAKEDVRHLAIRALADVGDVCLLSLADTCNDRNQNIETRLAALEIISRLGNASGPHLIKSLNDAELAEAAYWHLRDRGNGAIPLLLAAETAGFSDDARALIQELVEELAGGIGGGPGDDIWAGGHALIEHPGLMGREATGGSMAPRKALAGTAPILAPEPNMFSEPAEMAEPEPAVESETDGSITPTPPPEPEDAAEAATTGYKTVKVFYGTNRKPLDENSESWRQLSWVYWVAITISVSGLIVFVVGAFRRRATVKVVAGSVVLAFVCFSVAATVAPSRELRRTLAKPGPAYGGDYSPEVEIGYCEVTIPDTHQEGELESVSLLRLQLREDPQKHVTLKSVRRLEPARFFEDLHSELRQRSNSILIFIHGYNVSFEDASRRTAQMSHDLKFDGASIFYSWPSQANWRKYRVDEKNVELSVDQLKTFLADIADRSGADTINLIAHSMGNRALTNALKEIEVSVTEDERLFNQVILAAPDIDADIFKQRIAPAIVPKARRITLYASSKDLALAASRKFNSGDPRAGDAGDHLVVVPGIDTIDVSAGDSSLLGHSYYGSSTSVLRDIELLLLDQPAASRQCLSPVPPEAPDYWLFQPVNTARRHISTMPR